MISAQSSALRGARNSTGEIKMYTDNDRYLNMYLHLQRKAEAGPLSEEELEQLALCESVLQKRHEEDEFDRWLDEAFGKKR